MTIQLPINICGRSFSNKDLETVRNIIKHNSKACRQALSQIICKEFGWVSSNGKLKEMSCRVAMLKLHRTGLIQLPLAQRPNVNGSKIKITSISDPQFPINKPISEIGEIEICSVKTKMESRLWNELIERYHYLGYKPLPGAQIRYLIYCQDGLVSAIGFSASAWKVAPRDKWIGWTSEQRQQRLHLIINNSRFLILPWVNVQHLASKILSLCAKRIKTDWYERYRYSPVLLETFVEKERFRGTCYKAANWIYVGQTQGRGKKDTHNLCLLPIKDIWMYPLIKDFRKETNK